MSKFIGTLIAAGMLASTTMVMAGSDTTTEMSDEEKPKSEMSEMDMSETATMMIDAELAEKGKKVFKKCKACHKIGDGARNATGPMLNGVYGADAGAVEGYKYSSAMVAFGADGGKWTSENLEEFLTKPKKFVKKTKMSFSGLKKEKDRKAIVEFLKTVSK